MLIVPGQAPVIEHRYEIVDNFVDIHSFGATLDNRCRQHSLGRVSGSPVAAGTASAG